MNQRRQVRCMDGSPLMMVLSLAVIGFLGEAQSSLAQPPTRDEAVQAMHRAVQFFRENCSAEGGYVYRLSADLQKREGEGKVGRTTAWIQPPGTPAVGMAYLDAYRLTGDPLLLDAAMKTADALLRGQLVSGGWMGFIEFDPQVRRQYAYRVDVTEVGHRKNWTTFDDDKSQSAMRFLMQLDRTLEFKNESIHEASLYALEATLNSQYPNGAWPQQFSEPHYPDNFPVAAASYPDDWSREFPNVRYTAHYTLNDNTISDIITTMLDAWDIYGDARYLAAAKSGGDFFVLAQMPDPQPGWAQQYDRDMHPVWARKFEPPAITAGESQGVMQTLLLLYRRTSEQKYLEPLSKALVYYRSSLLTDGRLARFYELMTNKPLYFTKDYRLTYDDSDLPTHYGFKTGSRLDQIAEEYDRLVNTPKEELWPADEEQRPQLTDKLTRQTESVIATMDERGAWIEKGHLRYHGGDDETRQIIASQTFCENLLILAEFVAATGD